VKSKRIRLVLASAVGLALVVLGTAYALRGRPVLLHVMAESGCACGEYHEEVTGIVVRNPFRDGSPEQSGAGFLQDLSNGRCVDSSSVCEYALPDHRVSEWRLVNRRDTRNRVQLFYKLTKYGELNQKYKMTGEGLIEVQPANGAWIVTNYSSYF
jgi:hypothetical protein